MPLIPADAKDVTPLVQSGYRLDDFRMPSGYTVASTCFAIGRNFKVRGYSAPVMAKMWADKILGEFYLVRLDAGSVYLVQAWPHPQNPQQWLVTATVER